MIRVKAIVEDRGIRPLDTLAIDKFKKSLAIGDRVEITFEKWLGDRSSQANRFFHAINGRFAAANGIVEEDCNIDFKFTFGIWLPVDEVMKNPPPWNGRLVDYRGNILFFKTTAEYGVKEFSRLIEGAISECFDSQVDIADIVQEYRG